jgi:hypothetical protein
MSQRIHYVRLTCYEDQEMLRLVGVAVELICYIAEGTLIWYMISYQNYISSEGLLGRRPTHHFSATREKATQGTNTTGIAYV